MCSSDHICSLFIITMKNHLEVIKNKQFPQKKQTVPYGMLYVSWVEHLPNGGAILPKPWRVNVGLPTCIINGILSA